MFTFGTNGMLLCVSAGVKLWSQQVCRHCGGDRATKDPRTLPTQADAGGRLAGTYRSHFRQSTIRNYLIKGRLDEKKNNVLSIICHSEHPWQ